MDDPNFKRDPFKSRIAEAYVTAINIIAVEYLVRNLDPDEYSRRCLQVCKLDEIELELLYIELSMNMHTSTLGAMITQGDYGIQYERLLNFLDNPEARWN